jgi:putative endonuclease
MTGGAGPRFAGDRAETLAESFLVQQGYFPLARKHRTRSGEVDLIVGKGELLVFAEVKQRRPRAQVDPIASVTPAKQRRIIRAALDYVQKHHLEDRAMRFDVIAITASARLAKGSMTIEHIEAAFDATAAFVDDHEQV